MQKIPTIFVRDENHRSLITSAWTPACEWVRNGFGVATRKYDGTSCMVRGANFFKRRELRPGDVRPADFEEVGYDKVTGKAVGWVPVDQASPNDRWHREALANMATWPADGTYELLGPKVQGNKDCFAFHVLLAHRDAEPLHNAPRTFEDLPQFLETFRIEGIVWHHPDGRMAKIKRRDFGLSW